VQAVWERHVRFGKGTGGHDFSRAADSGTQERFSVCGELHGREKQTSGAKAPPNLQHFVARLK